VVGSTGLKPILRKKRRSVAAEQLNYTKIVNHDEAAEILVIGVEMIEIRHVLTGHFERGMMIALAETRLLHQHREKATATRPTFSIVSCPS